jgi:hypothetical protein
MRLDKYLWVQNLLIKNSFAFVGNSNIHNGTGLGNTKNVVFPLTRPTLNFSPDPRNFIDPLKNKKSNLFQKYRTHFCIRNQCKDIQAVLHVYRGSMDTGNNSMKILIIVFDFAMYSLDLEIIF